MTFPLSECLLNVMDQIIRSDDFYIVSDNTVYDRILHCYVVEFGHELLRIAFFPMQNRIYLTVI